MGLHVHRVAIAIVMCFLLCTYRMKESKVRSGSVGEAMKVKTLFKMNSIICYKQSKNFNKTTVPQRGQRR